MLVNNDFVQVTASEMEFFFLSDKFIMPESVKLLEKIGQGDILFFIYLTNTKIPIVMT